MCYHKMVDILNPYNDVFSSIQQYVYCAGRQKNCHDSVCLLWVSVVEIMQSGTG